MNDSINIIRKLQQAGHEAYLVGGCVRDMYLKREIHDYDISTSATPEEVKEVFTSSKFVGQSFEVSFVRINGIDYEIATFRVDGDYSDQRRPDSVKFTRSLEEDASRRDFTMNALYYDPIHHRTIDPFNGLEDLNKGWLRFVGNPVDRISENPLRVLRGARFALQLKLTIHPESHKAIKENAELIKTLSIERCRDEMFKIVQTISPRHWIRLLVDLNLLGYIFPEFLDMHHTNQDPIYHPEGNVLKHSMLVAERLFDEGRYFDTVMCGLFHDLGK